MKYSRQAKLELLNSKSVQQPFDLSNMDKEEQDVCIAHQYVTHFSDNNHHDKVMDGKTVDIGTNFRLAESFHKEKTGCHPQWGILRRLLHVQHGINICLGSR